MEAKKKKVRANADMLGCRKSKKAGPLDTAKHRRGGEKVLISFPQKEEKISRPSDVQLMRAGVGKGAWSGLSKRKWRGGKKGGKFEYLRGKV